MGSLIHAKLVLSVPKYKNPQHTRAKKEATDQNQQNLASEQCNAQLSWRHTVTLFVVVIH